jgi:hypothetical protein
MTDNPFASPATASPFDYAAHVGRLLVVEPHSVETGVQTSLGPKDAVRASIHVIDGPEPEDYDDVLIFPRLLSAQIRSKLGQMVLGRLEQGAAKAGQNPPWRLSDATPADVSAGQRWLGSRRTFTRPAEPTDVRVNAAGGYTGEPPF